LEQGKLTLNAHNAYEMHSPYKSAISFLCLSESDIGIKEIGEGFILVFYLMTRSVALNILSRNAIWKETVVT